MSNFIKVIAREQHEQIQNKKETIIDISKICFIEKNYKNEFNVYLDGVCIIVSEEDISPIFEAIGMTL